MSQKLSKSNLSHQLLMGFGISLATVGLTTLGLNFFLIQSKLEQELEQRAQSITQGVGFSTEGLIELGNRSIIKRVVQNYATLPTVVEVAIVSPNGQTLARSGDALQNPPYASIHPELTQVLEQVSQTGSETSLRTTIDGKAVLVEILPFSSTMFGQANRRGMTIAILDVEELQQQAWKTFSTSTFTLLVGMSAILALMTVMIQRSVLHPLQRLNKAVTDSQSIDHFVMPTGLPDNEIQFLAHTIQAAATRVEAYQQLEQEVAQRKQAEAALLASEAQLRQQAQDLEKAIQDLQQVQMQIIQSEKMSALGNLVAGVAHEINNPVGFLKGSLSNATEYVQDLLNHLHHYQQAYPNPSSNIQDHAEEIDLEFLAEDLPKLILSMKGATDRVGDISTSLRTFSRSDTEHPVQFNLYQGLDSTLLILKYRLKANELRPAIEVVRLYDKIPTITCFSGQLNQVFMNILANAIDALEESNQRQSYEYLKQHPNRITIKIGLTEDQQSVIVRIKDNGIGMTDDVKQKIFEHLFTTKGVGKGTGLGLAIARQVIVDKHHGTLNCISSPGNGTEFIIEIPVQQAAYQVKAA
ncbi:histidine kinase [Nostoc sp. 'Peltigera membranacea cyanobiont' 210A]|uniref:sensor histidine kinase n=1 Tax=Nostoc sp. 'Peltigera membranacea cyanobiont' 210A TaxID=2014529 RepID=UPI000B953BC1|nr:ATP-binding protein [Nostoc sp. 'Peltigera membranacea cyanobiont' 210A]OYD98096.1 histidine kinase [Nostoc sp. 'Peltigera membranacea cyanobiont' 210A]